MEILSNMNNDIPEWITILALDIYRLIQKYDALAYFQEKVREWVLGHEAEVNRYIEWRRQRNLYFEQAVNSDPRLQDEKSGPPDEGWKWEIHPLNISPQIDPDTKRSIKIVKVWVPPELLEASEPDIKHILPLSREQQLSLTEKYTLLAAIYDFGRKGTDQIPPWVWPDLNTDVSSDELADAKKCLSFESLCGDVSRLEPGEEGWLKAMLDDVKNDLRKNRPSAKNPILSKPFLNNLLRASIKHLPYVGSFLYDVIYGTVDQPQTKLQLDSTPDDNIETEHRKVNSGEPKKEKGGWGKKIGVILVGLGVIVSILVFLFGDNILGRIKTPNLSGNSVDVNNVVFETRPTAYEIIEEIKELPVYERDAAAENYKGRTFKWSLRFKSLGPKEPEMRYVICEASPVRGEVVFYINADAKENLKIKKAKEGVFFDVSGEIERISLVRETQIKLKDVRLEFFD